jgi:hypothetical protein
MTKASINFQSLVRGYVNYHFPLNSEVIIEKEVSDETVVKYHLEGHIMELQSTQGGQYLTVILKFNGQSGKSLDGVKNLENRYQKRRDGNMLYLGIKKEWIPECTLGYELDSIIRDFKSLINYYVHGVVSVPRYLQDCSSYEEAVERANEISKDQYSALKAMENHFNKISEPEFEKYPENTEFVFDERGDFRGIDIIAPPSAYVMIKRKYCKTLEGVIKWLHQNYDDQTTLMDYHLQDLHHDFKFKNYFNKYPFDDLDFAEATEHCRVYGDQELYSKQFEVEPFEKYLQQDSLVLLDHIKKH